MKPSKDEQWCIENCTKGCIYKPILGMVTPDGTPCARNTCKHFNNATKIGYDAFEEFIKIFSLIPYHGTFHRGSSFQQTIGDKTLLATFMVDKEFNSFKDIAKFALEHGRVS